MTRKNKGIKRKDPATASTRPDPFFLVAYFSLSSRRMDDTSIKKNHQINSAHLQQAGQHCRRHHFLPHRLPYFPLILRLLPEDQHFRFQYLR